SSVTARMTRARVSEETSDRPLRTFEAVGTVVPDRSATSARVVRLPLRMARAYRNSLKLRNFDENWHLISSVYIGNNEVRRVNRRGTCATFGVLAAHVSISDQARTHHARRLGRPLAGRSDRLVHPLPDRERLRGPRRGVLRRVLRHRIHGQ